MRVGTIVTIITDCPAGLANPIFNVKGETGVITDFDDEDVIWQIKTGNPDTTGFWYSQIEFRLATPEEIANKLRFLLM